MSINLNKEEISLNVIKLLKKSKLKIKNTIIMDKHRYRADIFRTDDFYELFNDEKEENLENLKEIFVKYDIDKNLINSSENILKLLIDNKILIRLNRYHDITDTKKYKFPRKMEIHSVI